MHPQSKMLGAYSVSVMCMYVITYICPYVCDLLDSG